ncbi:PREDICTED: peptidase inhibitor 16-like [Branchiostoma belcheri]|uniref:Peptidase inhibitor 16-like n=1 Tax=Branchiostoma belcheri TaxID=7741 RepID=A0A6P5AER9_BRABE|nr:PREDICTED: peptidase inhibitor 16-like [Branchiostoma belcheri]
MIVLTAHDELRREVQAADMEKMDWDTDLEKMAMDWATCSRLGTRETNLVEELFGQNIALSPEGDVVGLLQQWMAQREYYSYHNNTCVGNNTCRDYVQAVWAATNRVGCALVPDCESKERKISMLVCYYSPPKERWTKPYHLGDSCTKCPRESPFCDKGLCEECANPIWHDDGFDECAFWENVPGDCDTHRAWHARFCPANCQFGCRTK